MVALVTAGSASSLSSDDIEEREPPSPSDSLSMWCFPTTTHSLIHGLLHLHCLFCHFILYMHDQALRQTDLFIAGMGVGIKIHLSSIFFYLFIIFYYLS